MAPWADLPPELLGLAMAKLPNPADRVRSHAVCRAVCRGWHSAVHAGVTATARQCLPWIMLIQDGYFLDPSDGSSHRLPSFPDDGILIGGSTDGWLILGHGTEYVEDHARKYHLDSYLLHNPFSHTSVPLAELDAAFGIRKFLMRSDADDLVAVLTDDKKCPLVLVRLGKGVWTAKPREVPYINTIDLAFLGDKLYGITKAEDLISLDLSSDANGTPMTSNYKRVIRQPLGYDDDHDAWTDNDDEEEEEEEEDGEENDRPIPGPYDYSIDEETKEYIITMRNLVESRGKLLMVRRQLQIRKENFTRQVDVFEADTENGMWLPLPIGSGLGGGRVLFIGSSIGFSKSVFAPSGEVEEDTIYFIDTGEVFSMKFGTCRLPRWLRMAPNGMTWIFPPELVV